MRSWRTELDRLRNLTAEYPRRQTDIAELEQLTAAAISRLKQRSAAARNRDPTAPPTSQAPIERRPTMDRVRGIVDRMMAEEDARIEALRREVLRDMLVAGGHRLAHDGRHRGRAVGLNKLLRRYGAPARARRKRAARSRISIESARRAAHRRAHRTIATFLRVSEEEKAKLARELHDTLGSNLTAINMDLNWIQRRLPEGAREVKERLQRVLQMLTETWS